MGEVSLGRCAPPVTAPKSADLGSTLKDKTAALMDKLHILLIRFVNGAARAYIFSDTH